MYVQRAVSRSISAIRIASLRLSSTSSRAPISTSSASSIVRPSFASINSIPSVAPSSVRFYSAGPSPPTKEEIEARILQILKDFDKVDPTKLSADSHFVNDLGLDSLDQVEITMAIEEEFNIELPDKDAEEILTVKKAVEKIYANKNAM